MDCDKLLTSLITMLTAEGASTLARTGGLPRTWESFRALVNVRPPLPASPEFLRLQDELLQGETRRKGVADAAALPFSAIDPRLSVWRGDITALKVDAIVNAANPQLLGCWTPGHNCVDNAIHTYAGIQLRMACAELMCLQKHDEPVGQAKVTPGFNLPAAYVLHTVGPQVEHIPSPEDEARLASCYHACLDAADTEGLCSLAFCCVSAGVYGYPPELAAPVAVSSVRTWMDTHAHASVTHVVFAVHGDTDERLYQKLLG